MTEGARAAAPFRWRLWQVALWAVGIAGALAGGAPVALLRSLLGVVGGLATSAALVWATSAAGQPLRVLVALAVGAGTGWAAQHITFARRRADA